MHDEVKSVSVLNNIERNSTVLVGVDQSFFCFVFVLLQCPRERNCTSVTDAVHCKIQRSERLVFATLKRGAKRNKDLSGYQRGIIKGVVTGACTFQHHLHASGQAETDTCPFCDTGDAETATHAY